MKAVWYGITGLMAAFAALIAWYSFDRLQSEKAAPLETAKPVQSQPETTAPEQKTARLTPPKTETPAKPETKPSAKPEEVPSTVKKLDEPTTQPVKKAKTPDKIAPTFDVVRVEPDGSAVIAGRAQPGWKVVVLSKGKVIGKATANARGEWVIISDQPVAAGTSNLKLTASSPDSTITTASSQIVAISRPAATLKAPGKMAKAVIPKAGAQALKDQPAPPSAEPDVKAAAETALKAADAGTPKPDMQAPKAVIPTKNVTDTAAAEAPAVAESKKAAEATAVKAQAPAPKSAVPAKAEPDTVTPDASSTVTPDASSKTAAAASPKSEAQSPETSSPAKAEPEAPAAKVVENKPAKPAKPLIVVSEPGQASRVLQAPAQGEKSAPLTFKSVDYNDKGQVILSGKAKKGSALRVYLNNDFIGTAKTKPDGVWVLKTRRDVNPGKYTLRVDQIGRGNKITSRVEAPFERAAPEAIKKARVNGEVIIQPGDNLWNISRALYGHGVQYTVIYEANKNKIRNPDFIYPGQIFTTPNKDPATVQEEREALRQNMLKRR